MNIAALKTLLSHPNVPERSEIWIEVQRDGVIECERIDMVGWSDGMLTLRGESTRMKRVFCEDGA